jgi:hypothetical protein
MIAAKAANMRKDRADVLRLERGVNGVNRVKTVRADRRSGPARACALPCRVAPDHLGGFPAADLHDGGQFFALAQHVPRSFCTIAA